MAIERDDVEERDTRVDRMIAEFQEARRRRLAPATGVRPRPHIEGNTESPASVEDCDRPLDEADV